MAMTPQPAPSPFQILDFVSSGCCIIGTGGQIQFWNQALEVWTRQTSASLIGQNLFEAFPQLAQARFQGRILEVLETGAPTVFSSALNPQFFPCVRPDGRPRIQQTALSRLPMAASGPLVLITVNDVTDQFERGEKYRSARAQALEEARIRGESEEQYRLIVGLTSSAILIGSTDGRIQDCNAAASRTFHYPKEEIIRLAISDLFPPKHAEMIRKVLAEELATGDHGLAVEARRKNGAAFPAEIIAKFFTAGGQRRLVAYIHDNTDRQRAEEALRYAHKQESLGVLAGGIAHDFNNLFCSVLGNLELASGLAGGKSPVSLYLERIRNEILRASELSQKMLALSGKGRFSLKKLDLNKVLEDLKPKLVAGLSQKADLIFRFAEGLPPIEGDAGQLQQVIQYLLANASEALDDKEGSIDLVTSIQDLEADTIRRAFVGQPLAPGRYVTVEVADTGCGIPPENLLRIFDPFFSTKFAGRGLSLAVAQGILRGHKAGFAISSAVGMGTRFKIFFPVVPVATAPPRSVKQETGAISGLVLLVDDEPVLLEATAEMLEAAGYRVATAKDGLEAVEYYKEHQAEIALVLMDLTMPRMDGKAAFHAIRALNPAAWVVLSSGFSEHDAIHKFHSEGLGGFLPKPYRRAQLEEIVGRFVKPKKG